MAAEISSDFLYRTNFSIYMGCNISDAGPPCYVVKNLFVFFTYIDLNSGLELTINMGLYVCEQQTIHTCELFRNSHLSSLITIFENKYNFHNLAVWGIIIVFVPCT